MVKPARDAQFLTFAAIGRTLSGMVRGGVLAAIAGLVALSGCSFVLDFSEPSVDAAPAEDAADVTCDDDEPNDSLETATATTSGTIESSLCPASDVDFYGFSIVDSDLIASLTFDGERADLRLTLFDAAGNAITVAAGNTGEERIERSEAQLNTLPAGDYALEVSNESTTGNDVPYTLDVSGPSM